MHIRTVLFHIGYCYGEQRVASLVIAAHSVSAIDKDLIHVCQRYPAGGPNETVAHQSE